MSGLLVGVRKMKAGALASVLLPIMILITCVQGEDSVFSLC